MKAILKREFAAYFNSMLGYVIIGAFFLFSGYFFFSYNLLGNSTDMRNLFASLFVVALFLIPILTMRLMSEDKKLKTDQALLTAPISTLELVMGKYIAAVLVYLLAISCTLILAAAVSFIAQPDWPLIIGHFIGLALLGMALISIGMFISALTENQVIAAVGGFSVGFFLMLVETLSPAVSSAVLAEALRQLSFQNRYEPFTLGILDFSGLVFFLSVSSAFVFFTISSLEQRRYG